MHGAWPWVLMALLGAYHGLNPAMGWLFAVALGMQEGRRSAVTRLRHGVDVRPNRPRVPRSERTRAPRW